MLDNYEKSNLEKLTFNKNAYEFNVLLRIWKRKA